MTEDKISAEDLVKIVQGSDLDKTIKEILIRDIQNEGVNEFLLEQVIAYCENAAEFLKKQNPPT